MAAYLESMFYTNVDSMGNRFTPWHGMGTPVNEAKTSDEAIKLAGLDWEVLQAQTFVELNGIKIPTESIANYRSTDYKVLGTVKSGYKVVQNSEAFAFTDELLNMDAKYVTAGSLAGGKHIWLLAQLPTTKVLDDDIENFILFANTHDGTGAVKVCETPVRVVCQNTLNMALKSAKRFFSFVHKGNVMNRLEEAKKVLNLSEKYKKEFAKEAERLAMFKMNSINVQQVLAKMFPTNEDTTIRQLNNIERKKDGIFAAYNRDDLGNFRGSAYGFLNAVSDSAFHDEPLRKTSTWKENKMLDVMRGNNLFDTAYDIISEMAA